MNQQILSIIIFNNKVLSAAENDNIITVIGSENWY